MPLNVHVSNSCIHCQQICLALYLFCIPGCESVESSPDIESSTLLSAISEHFDASGWSTFGRVVFEVWSLGTMGGRHAATRLKAGRTLKDT